MKKRNLLRTALLLMCSMMIVPSVIAQQTQFEGNQISKHHLKYEKNVDLIVETVKQNIDKNDTIDEKSKAVAKMFAKSIVKNTLKQQEMENHFTSLPDGDYILYSKVKGNSSISFSPDLGRVIVRFPGQGYDYIIFPKIKLGCKVEYVPTKQIEDNYSKKNIVNTDKNITEINGIPCIPNFALIKYEQIGGELIDTITYNGVLYVVNPMPGYVHVDYQTLGIQTSMVNEFFTREDEIIQLDPIMITDDNFVLPPEYKIVDTKSFVKKVKKIINKDPSKLSIPYSGSITENMWDMVK